MYLLCICWSLISLPSWSFPLGCLQIWLGIFFAQGIGKSFLCYVFEMLSKQSRFFICSVQLISLLWIHFVYFELCIGESECKFNLLVMRVNVTVCDMTFRDDLRTQGLLLTSSKNEVVIHGSANLVPATQQYKGNSEWETLEIYLVYIFLIFSFLYPLDPSIVHFGLCLI